MQQRFPPEGEERQPAEHPEGAVKRYAQYSGSAGTSLCNCQEVQQQNERERGEEGWAGTLRGAQGGERTHPFEGDAR